MAKETVRLRGIARGSMERSKLDAGTAETRTHDEGKAFVLESDGTRINVDASGADLRLVPEVTVEGSWNDLKRDPRAAIFCHDAENDLVLANASDVVLTHAGFVDGDAIVIHAEVLERSFDQGTGHREAPRNVIKDVRALVIATGENADAVLDTALAEGPRKPVPRRREKVGLQRKGRWPIYLLVLAIVCFVLLIVSLRHWPTPLVADFFCTMCVALCGSMFAWWVKVRTTFYADGKPMHPRNPFSGAPWAVFLGLAFTFAPLGVITHLSVDTPSLNLSLASVFFWGVAALSFVLLTRRATKDQLELLDALLTSRITGTVRDPTPVNVLGATGPLALAAVSEEKVVEGSSPDIVIDRILNKGTFEVLVDGKDEKLEIDPTKAIWASTVRVQARFEEERVIGQTVRIHTDVVPIGGSIIVQTDGTPTKSGTIFYAAPGTVDPRRAVTKARDRLQRAYLGMLLSCIVVFTIGTILSLAAGTPNLPIKGD